MSYMYPSEHAQAAHGQVDNSKSAPSAPTSPRFCLRTVSCSREAIIIGYFRPAIAASFFLLHIGVAAGHAHAADVAILGAGRQSAGAVARDRHRRDRAVAQVGNVDHARAARHGRVDPPT
eukprot:5013802-Prymnesium_polylepis.1